MQEGKIMNQKGWKNHSLAEGKFSPGVLWVLCINTIEYSHASSFPLEASISLITVHVLLL